MRRELGQRLLTSTAAFAAVVLATAQSFVLDTAFRTNIESEYVNSILPLADGTVIISGRMKFPGDMSFRSGALLNLDGTRNLSFADVAYMGGKLTRWNDRVYAGNGPGMRRQFLNGTLDLSFDMVNAPYFSALQGGDYLVYPDGRVLMSGAHTLSDTVRGFEGLYNLIWFSNQGYLDTTRTHRKGNGAVYAFKELGNGQFICSGTCTQFDGHPCDKIFKVNADGALDTIYHTGVNWGEADDYLPLEDGRIYFAGNFRRAVAPEDTLKLARFLADGSLDPSFASPHFTLGVLPGGLYGMSLSRLHDRGQGRIIAMGNFQYVNGLPRRGICMIDSTGAVMDVFDDCGVGPYVYQNSTYGWLNGIMPDADSTHYYIWGAYNGYDDGTTNDLLQRFVTRLHGGDISTAAHTHAVPEAPMSVYPNPTSGACTVALEALPRNATLVVRDALGREVQRNNVTDHYTTLTMAHSGVYSVEVWDARGRMATERLVVE
ncbi:MAG: T9SS type A sorting domain-containing protein [Flavobacteriales bacterium]